MERVIHAVFLSVPFQPGIAGTVIPAAFSGPNHPAILSSNLIRTILVEAGFHPGLSRCQSRITWLKSRRHNRRAGICRGKRPYFRPLFHASMVFHRMWAVRQPDKANMRFGCTILLLRILNTEKALR